MPVRILLPLRSIGDGKRRLIPVLPDDQRQALILSMFVATLEAAAAVVGRDKILVVSASQDVLAVAAGAGAAVVREEGQGGLNAALHQAAATARRTGARSVLALSCDLPLLTPEDIQAMLDAGKDAPVVIAPDEAGTGTNALFTAPPGIIDYRFGPHSCAAHAAAAKAVRLEPFLLRRTGLGCDLDTPADLVRLRSRHGWVPPGA